MNKLPLLLGFALLAGVVQMALATKIIADPAALMAIPLACIGYVVVIWQCQRIGLTVETRRFLTRLGITGLTVRLLLGGTLLATGVAGFFGADFLTYHEIGSGVANHWLGGPPLPQGDMNRYLNLGSGKSHGSRAGYYYFVAFFYALCGTSEYVMAVVMSILGALSCLLVYAIGRDMFTEQVGRRAGALACLFPSVVLWTCLGYKDGLTIFCLLLAYPCTQLLQRKLDILPGLGLVLSLGASYYVRGYIFYVAVGPIILALTSRNSGEKRVFYNQLFGLLILVVALFASGLGNNLLNQLQEVNLK
ncbi:MAG: glycosyltransferase family 39 protein, partial [Candidatus Sericytochromatia bacterium]|nr:glycosyltransferase family 39 protein [Candidatus Sericytochromatia bacterium]